MMAWHLFQLESFPFLD